MNSIKNYISKLSEIMTVSGFEYQEKEKVISLGNGIFDDVITDSVGSYLFVKKSRKENAPRLLIDTHIDQIGMMATEICEDGFVKFTSVGGLDSQILQGAEVYLYGKEKVYGVITSVPPHLQTKETKDKLESIENLYIDTGYSKEKLSEIISVGAPISFAEGVISLANDILAGTAFDNKASCACALDAISSLKDEELAFDVYLLFSAREEHGGFVGAYTGSARAKADIAISIDTNFARAPEINEFISAETGKGPTVSISCVTSRKYTKKVISLANSNSLPCQIVAEPNNVGTNANILGLTNMGIPCVDLGIPLGSMHTFSETVSLRDCKTLSRLLALIMSDTELSKEVADERKN